jgi:hypothetical protein
VAAPAAGADVLVGIVAASAPATGVPTHTYDANGVLVAGAPTAPAANGLYTIPSSALAGVAFPLQVRVDPVVDPCTGQTIAPVTTIAADGTGTNLSFTPTVFCADPAPTTPSDRLTINGMTITGVSGGSADAYLLTLPTDTGTVEFIDIGMQAWGSVPVQPGGLYTRFRFTAPATEFSSIIGVRWTSGGATAMLPIGNLSVRPAQPAQGVLGAGGVDVFLAIDASAAAAAADPGGVRRADATRLLQLLVPKGSYALPMAWPAT